MSIYERGSFALDSRYLNEERKEPYQSHKKERSRKREVCEPMHYVEYENTGAMYESFIVNKHRGGVNHVNITNLSLKVLVTILLLSFLLFGYYFFLQSEQMKIMQKRIQLLDQNIEKELIALKNINSKLFKQINVSRTHFWKETKLVETEQEIRKNTLLTKIDKLGKEFSVQFEVLTTFIYKRKVWSNVLHFTNTTDNSEATNARAPAVWFYEGYIYVAFTTRLFKSSKSYKPGKWISVKITQHRDVSNYILSCRINGNLVSSDVNYFPIEIPNVMVYLSNSWDEYQPGLISKLSVFDFESL